MQLDIRQTFYISRSRATPAQLEDILARARQANASRGVTGALLYTGGHFAQVLEGPGEALAATMAGIALDPRHECVRRLIDSPLPERRFAAWSMAFLEAPGADDLMAEVLNDASVSPERAERLLGLMFRP